MVKGIGEMLQCRIITPNNFSKIITKLIFAVFVYFPVKYNLHLPTHLIFITTPGDSCYYHPHFAEKQTEALTECITCQRSRSWLVAEPGFEAMQYESQF